MTVAVNPEPVNPEAVNDRLQADLSPQKSCELTVEVSTQNSVDVPDAVKETLQADLLIPAYLESGIGSGASQEKEEILFCEPPRFSDGYMGAISGMWSPGIIQCMMLGCVGWVDWHVLVYIVSIGSACSLMLLLLMIRLRKFKFYGYKVITNHRVALVIPHQHFLFGKPAVKSLFFWRSITELRLPERLVGFHPDHFVSVFRSETSRGFVAFNSPHTLNQSIRFRVESQDKFEKILTDVLKKVVAHDLNQNFDFQITPKCPTACCLNMSWWVHSLFFFIFCIVPILVVAVVYIFIKPSAIGILLTALCLPVAVPIVASFVYLRVLDLRLLEIWKRGDYKCLLVLGTSMRTRSKFLP